MITKLLNLASCTHTQLYICYCCISNITADGITISNKEMMVMMTTRSLSWCVCMGGVRVGGCDVVMSAR